MRPGTATSPPGLNTQARTVAGTAGADRYMFNGKIGGHTLAAGSYQLIATPAGSAHDTTTFTIVS